MTAQQPGAEMDPDAMWSPALARGLIRDDVMHVMRCCDGYTDLLGPSAPPRYNIAQRVMRGLHGMSIPVERNRAATALRLVGEQRVLDVACGPGDFTGLFADGLMGDGFVIGLDPSVAMMERAVHDNSRARAVYMRADTLRLPFSDGVFDAVCRFAPHAGAVRRAPRDGSGAFTKRKDRGDNKLRSRIGPRAEGDRNWCHDLRGACLRPHHHPGLPRSGWTDRHRPAPARNLPACDRTPARSGHRHSASAHPVGRGDRPEVGRSLASARADRATAALTPRCGAGWTRRSPNRHGEPRPNPG